MKLEVLIATMNRENMDFLQPMNLQTDAVVINQCDREKEESEEHEGKQIKMLSFAERGLSRSRNRALEAATADICLIADDDVIYDEGYEKKIIEAYEYYPEADLIAFQIQRIGNARLKRFRKKSSKQNWISCMKISSVEITFRRASIEEKGIKFNTLFGAGTYFNNGEENIFLYDCLRKKLNIRYVPVQIGSVCCDESTWFEGYDRHYFESMGAGYYGMSKTFGWLLCFQHLIRHYKLYQKDMSFYQVAAAMRQGRKECRKMKRIQDGKIRSFIIGDFRGTNGPAIVNQSLKRVRGKISRYSMAHTKVGRIIEVLVKSIGMDAIGLSGLSQVDRLALRWAKLLHKPTFYIMHGYAEKELMLEDEENQRLVALERSVLEKVDQIIPVSKRFQEYLQQEMPMYKFKFKYINNGIDWENLKAQLEERMVRAGYIITSIGGGLRRKNNLAVCKAIDKIRQHLEYPIKYVIVGQPGRDIEAICQYDFVEYLGQVSHIDVLKLLGQSHVYVQNSYLEPFSLAVVEALMSGCDVLVSKEVGALSILEGAEGVDIIQNNEDIDEIAQKLLSHLKQSNNQRLMSYIKQENTSWQASSNQLTQIIEKL